MLTPTHLLVAQTAYLAGCVVAAHPPAPAEALAALGAALIPDLDSRQSYVGRVLPPLSDWIEGRFGHRALTHSLFAQAAAGALAWALLPFGFFLAVVAGWVSHAIADMMMPSGVAWFWPARGRCVLPGNPRYRMEVMGRGELVFLGIMAVLGLILMPLARTGEGTTGLIRSAIGDVMAARQEYDAGKGSHAFTLDLRGRDNRSYADISGTYALIGPYRDTGFILRTDQGPRSVCRSAACDWYADHASLVRGAMEETTSFEIRAKRTSAGSLIDSLRPLESAGRVYLLGDLVAPGVRAAPPTVAVSGETVTLSYAEPQRLDAWRGRALRELDLSVQVRHPPGTAVQEPLPLASAGPPVDPLLAKWLERSKKQRGTANRWKTFSPAQRPPAVTGASPRPARTAARSGSHRSSTACRA